jgi:integrase/recombinase XerD
MKQPCLEPSFPALVQDFFCQRLIAQRNVSPRTVASYRDTFRLLLRYAEEHLKKHPTQLVLSDLDAALVSSFLEYVEKIRGNSPRSRNLRLAAIRAFMRYGASRNPACLATIERVLAIPNKRFCRPLLGFLSRLEMEAILAAPDRSTWSGRRDHVMLATFYNTGARVSELTGLRVQDVKLDRDPAVHLHGKGRKQRAVPLWKRTALVLGQWLRQNSPHPLAPVFPNRLGNPLSRSGVEHRLRLAVRQAATRCPSLVDRKVSPHTLRHTTAMHLLQSGVDITIIALWLGHESPTTTHQYIEADMKMKERALGAIQEPPVRRNRYKPTDRLLAFLESL